MDDCVLTSTRRSTKNKSHSASFTVVGSTDASTLSGFDVRSAAMPHWASPTDPNAAKGIGRVPSNAALNIAGNTGVPSEFKIAWRTNFINSGSESANPSTSNHSVPSGSNTKDASREPENGADCNAE